MVRTPSLPGAGAALAPALVVPAFAQGAPAAGPVTGLLVAALLLLTAGLFAVRKRPRESAAAVIPRFRPPEGVSAALAAYLGDRGVTARLRRGGGRAGGTGLRERGSRPQAAHRPGA